MKKLAGAMLWSAGTWCVLSILLTLGLAALAWLRTPRAELGDVAWVASFVGLWLLQYGLPGAVVAGGPAWRLTQATTGSRKAAAPVALVAAVAALCLYWPWIERCQTSATARNRLSVELTPAQLASLRTPPTLSDSVSFCPLYFEYRDGDEVVGIMAAADFIHGTKLFRDRRPANPR